MLDRLITFEDERTERIYDTISGTMDVPMPLNGIITFDYMKSFINKYNSQSYEKKNHPNKVYIPIYNAKWLDENATY